MAGEPETVGLFEKDVPGTPVGVGWVPAAGAHAVLISATARVHPTRTVAPILRTRQPSRKPGTLYARR
jgi:hypothetical protein